MSFDEERDRAVIDIVGHDVGNFPLQRLSEKYGIQFTEHESEVIEVMHKYIWIHFRSEVHELPVAFRGTPLELWAVIMYYSVSPSKTDADIGRKMIPDSLYQEFIRINHWGSPLTPTVQSILKKICRERTPIMMDNSRGAFNSFRYYQCTRTPQTIQDAVEKLSAATDAYDDPFPVESRLGHVKFTDAEMAMIRINYTHLLWKQFLSDDEYMAPASEEGTPMEIWLVSSLLMDEYPLKTGHKFRTDQTLGALAYFKYYPDNISPETIFPENILGELQYCIMSKLSKQEHEEFHINRERMWPLTMALAKRTRTQSKIGELPPEIIQNFQKLSWDKYYTRRR
jgi:hypothetical protein